MLLVLVQQIVLYKYISEVRYLHSGVAEDTSLLVCDTVLLNNGS
jgi:hypothetical protein